MKCEDCALYSYFFVNKMPFLVFFKGKGKFFEEIANFICIIQSFFKTFVMAIV